MGGVASNISSGIRNTMEETQELMLRRQIELNACQIRERQMAMNLARQRDMTNFMGAFYAIAAPLLIHKARSGSPAMAAPLLPLTFVLAYNADMAYGNKIARIRAEAERILNDPIERAELLSLPLGEPTCVRACVRACVCACVRACIAIRPCAAATRACLTTSSMIPIVSVPLHAWM